MALKDPSFLPRLRTVRREQTFSNPDLYDDWEVTFTFEAQEGSTFWYFINQKKDEILQEYTISGANIVDNAGNEILMSAKLAHNIAFLLALDKSVPGKGELKYDIAKWAILFDRAPDIFDRCIAFGNALVDEACPQPKKNDNEELDRESESLKNDSAATGVFSSVPPTTPIDSTPTS